MIHYILCIRESFIRIFLQKLFKQIFGLIRMEVVELGFIISYKRIHFLSLLTVEGWLTGKHFINYATKAPPITFFAVRSIFLQELRCKVLWSATKAFSSIVAIYIFFWKFLPRSLRYAVIQSFPTTNLVTLLTACLVSHGIIRWSNGISAASLASNPNITVLAAA